MRNPTLMLDEVTVENVESHPVRTLGEVEVESFEVSFGNLTSAQIVLVGDTVCC